MRNNRLRELLNEGKPTLGTAFVIPWPRIVEVIGHIGAFDYIEYVSEDSTYNIEQLENFGRAIELFPNMSLMIKVEEQLRGFVTTRAVDAGFQSVLFTDCRSAEDVRQCIRLVRAETPEDGGVHGVTGRRITIGSNFAEWLQAMKDTVIAFMIEKKGAVENLEEILSVKGVDMVQFGPVDYSVSVGKPPSEIRSPEARKIQRDIIELALKKGVAPRVVLSSPEQAKPYIDMGVRHFRIGGDLGTIRDWCRQQGEGVRELLASV